MSTPKVQRTYSSRNKQAFRPPVPSSPPSTLSSSPVAPPAITRPTKRRLSENDVAPEFPLAKRLKAEIKPTVKAKASTKSASKVQKTLRQLHFNIDQSILRTCSLCNLSYTKGAPDDEALHRSHCARIRQGMEWGKDEDKGNGITEVETGIKLKTGKKRGRIVAFSADATGKLGTKLSTLLNTINLSLSAPELPPSVLQASKAYLFLVAHDTLSHRERIAGCVIAQRISTAMAVVAPPSSDESPESSSDKSTSADSAPAPIIVDINTNLYCNPTPLPTPMGIPRIFVSSSFRRQGIAKHLLNAAARTFIHGCPLDPLKGQAAFSQPTGMGQAVMMDWGKGAVRVYEE
ncbi:hypothetical protein CVT24_011606 [Panaeolus cyanescens]|uniref:N-acetyltransferase domain-containing protein n=1 Tax=Panaeolus cyanescens TaxID=181874 RepID=A0A409YGW1_9AGAR|nr:hypothetical protein CVT24_011606 [Panaeolus cyanescens]